MNKKSYFNSQIATRISKKMAGIYSGIYVILLLLLFVTLTPLLYHSAYRREQEIHSIFTEEYASFQAHLVENTNSLTQDFYNLVNIYIDNPTETNKALLVQSLSAYTASYDNFITVGIHLPSGEYVSSIYYTNIGQEELLGNNKHYQNLLTVRSGSYYSPVYINGVHRVIAETAEDMYYDLIYYSKNISYGTKTFTLTVFYNVTTLLENNKALNDSAFEDYLIIDKHGELIYTSSPIFSETFFANVDSSDYAHSSGDFPLSSGLCFYKRIISTGWTVVSYVSFPVMLQNFILIMVLVTALYLVSPILYTLFLIPVTKHQLAPIKTLSDTMSSFQAGLAVSSDIHTGDELEYLSNTFNQMVLEINKQVENIRRQEHENAVVSYKLLATQIDPHFIYNTMNIINILARQGNTAAIVDINTSLVRILRERLNSKLSIFDTIRNEYDTMIQYELIMDYRYKHQIKIHYDIDDSLMDYQIPKNILQPLVENSFFHGFSNNEHPLSGSIDIFIYVIEDDLIIEVSDNGKGITPERLDQINQQSYHIYDDKKPHIGLNNIRQRLSYIYKDNYQMEIHSTLDIGTTIIISFPKEIPRIL